MKHENARPRPLLLSLCFLLFSLLLLAVSLSLLFLSRFLWGEETPSDMDVSDTPTGLVVVLDAGHGGEDGGAVGQNRIPEKVLNLAIAQTVRDLLHASGVHVLMTRDRDILLYDRDVDYHGRKKVLDLAARLKIARENEGCLFVSIHMNAFPEEKYSGLQVYYSPHHPESRLLAERIQTNAVTYLQPSNERRPKAATSSIFLLDRIESPAVLIECGFLSHPAECALLATPEYQQKLSLLIADAILAQLSNTPS